MTQDLLTQDSYMLVNTPAAFLELIGVLERADTFSFDTETSGLDVVNDRPIGIAFSVAIGQGFYVPLMSEHLRDGLHPMFVRARLATLFTAKNKLKIAHNLKFDLQMLANAGMAITEPFADTMVMSMMLASHEREHSLAECSKRWLKRSKLPFNEFQKWTDPGSGDHLQELTRYAARDADLCLHLYQVLAAQIEKSAGLANLMTSIEIPFVPVIAEMERTGAYVESWSLIEIGTHLDELRHRLEARILGMAGEPFAISSPKQLARMLYEKLKVHETNGNGLNHPRIKQTAYGLATDSMTLTRFRHHPIVDAVLTYKTLAKLKNTYVDALPKLIHEKTGRIHSHFHQNGTATGRLSSSKPNLQNIPIQTPLGSELRRSFRPQSADHLLISADYSQIELRLLAHLSQDHALITAFNKGRDIHQETAARLFRRPIEQITKQMRSQAKVINFGVIYGMTPYRLALETGRSIYQANRFIHDYFCSFPGVKRYRDESVRAAWSDAISTSLLGRQRNLSQLVKPGRSSPSQAFAKIAMNNPIQSTAADIIKLAMVRIHRDLKSHNMKTRLIMQVHDELIYETPHAELEDASAVIRSNMEEAVSLAVPLPVELGFGGNWLEAHF